MTKSPSHRLDFFFTLKRDVMTRFAYEDKPL